MKYYAYCAVCVSALAVSCSTTAPPQENFLLTVPEHPPDSLERILNAVASDENMQISADTAVLGNTQMSALRAYHMWGGGVSVTVMSAFGDECRTVNKAKDPDFSPSLFGVNVSRDPLSIPTKSISSVTRTFAREAGKGGSRIISQKDYCATHDL
jgi:hypothetical protein